MRFNFLALLLMACLLVIPVSSTVACGSKKAGHKKEMKAKEHKKMCCDRHADQKKGNKSIPCDHNCNQSGCDCGHAVPVFALKAQPSFSLQKKEYVTPLKLHWFFIQMAPKPVYLSLWMPPNLSCLLS